MAGDKVESISWRAKWDSPCGLLRGKITGTDAPGGARPSPAAPAPAAGRPAAGPARGEPARLQEFPGSARSAAGFPA